jgi:hypothetical protein
MIESCLPGCCHLTLGLVMDHGARRSHPDEAFEGIVRSAQPVCVLASLLS